MGEGQDSHPSALVAGDSDVNSGTTWNLEDIRSNFATDLTGYVVREGNGPSASDAFWDIYRGTLRMSGRSIRVAVKAIRTYSVGDIGDAMLKMPEMVNREIRAWLHLDHINVLPLFGTTMGFGPFPAMVCPWLENGSLTSYLERRNDTLTKVERLTLLGDVAAGLQYLHSQFVVHGDLSGSNVLIDDKGRARISDFGLLTLLAELETPTFETSIPRKRTLRWAAPELLGASGGGVNPSPQSDVYSFGGIMLQILTGKVPYHYLVNDAPVVLAIRKGETPKRPSEDLVTDRQWAFMQRCWTPATVARPSGEEIVEFVRRELVLTTHRGTQPQGPKDEGKDVGEKGEGEHLPAPGSPEDTYINTHPQGPKDDAEGENVEEDRFPNELSWLRDVLKSSAVAPLGGTNETPDPLGANFLKDVVPASDVPLPVDEVRRKRFAKFRVRDVFARKREDGEVETQVPRLPKRAFKFRTMLTWKKKDATQPRLDRQQAVVGAKAQLDAEPAATPRESTAKDKGKHKDPNPNPNPAGNTGRASFRTTKHRPATSASRNKRRLPDRVARVRQADMGRRNGSTTRAQSRLENTTVGYGNSTERDAAEPSRVRKDSSNRRPWFRRTRDPEVVEVMEGHMPDRYVSGHKYANKRSSSVESESGDTEDVAEDSDEDEADEAPRNKTPGGLIGILCFCSCIP